METQSIQVAAGFACSAIFLSSSLPIQLQAFKSKDLRSTSFGVPTHIADVPDRIYPISLPVGQVWFLQELSLFPLR